MTSRSCPRTMAATAACCVWAIAHADGGAVNALEGFASCSLVRADTLLVPPGRHELLSDVEIDSTTTVVIRAGATLAIGPGVGILSRGPLHVLGTEAEPVIFTWLVPGSVWGSVAIAGETAGGSVLRHCTFEHGSSKLFADSLGASGAFVSYFADVSLTSCTFSDNTGGDGLNVKYARAIVEDCTFIRQLDAIDFDSPDSCEIVHSRFYDCEDDAIDLGGPRTSFTACRYNVVENAQDKGFSVQRVSALIENNIVVGGHTALAIKDGADPIVGNNTFVSNSFGIRAYEKDPGGGGGRGTVISTIIFDSDTASVYLDSLSTTALSYSDIENGWTGEGNIDSDPTFATYGGMDHVLAPGSPCIDAGDPLAEDGIDWPMWYPNGPRADMGAFGGPGADGWLQ
ncbi:MAG: hypothetical protein CME06_09205 [Gemmatimonadetes bacterium]|nr:hypothetical protein [Gemmatimonadota bacterium]